MQTSYRGISPLQEHLMPNPWGQGIFQKRKSMSNRNKMKTDKKLKTEGPCNSLSKMILLLKLQKELVELKKHNVEEMDALRKENVRMKRKLKKAK